MKHKKNFPLCVDLDGTLLKTDTLLESLVTLLRQDPIVFLMTFAALFKGRAAFKDKVAQAILPDIDLLPMNNALLEWLRLEHHAGRYIVLSTGANVKIADAVARKLGIFNKVLSSNSERNLVSTCKASALIELFGKHRFDYAGNCSKDINIWKYAHESIVVGGEKLVTDAAAVSNVVKVFPINERKFITVLRALRLHQYIKNILIFLPLIAAHRFFDSKEFFTALLAFFVFSLTSSSAYLINDLLDIRSDRMHPDKCRRPFASGDLSLLWGIVLPPGLLLTSLLLSSSYLSATFCGILCVYFILTTLYSFYLKNMQVLDVVILSILYTLRVIAGGIAVSIFPSFWLLAFSMFLFFSLALVKRYSELKKMWEKGEDSVPGRSWESRDLPLIGSIGSSSSIASILVLALYIDSDSAHKIYSNPEILWIICPLMLYWTSRIWFMTYRGKITTDPVVFVMKDPVSIISCLIGIAILFISSL